MTDNQISDLLDLLAGGVEALTRIERHLGTLAEYAEMLRIEATGEKVYEVQSYVVSTTSQGDMCVYLYSTHPGMQYRVATVYQERLADLPFTIPGDAKIWDGEAAPSREGAAKKGYILAAPAPFKVSMLPTGGKTDKGETIHKFNRVIGADPIQAPAGPIAPPQEGRKSPALPVQSATTQNGANSTKAPAVDHQRQVLEREKEARKQAGPAPETPPQRFQRLARELGISETEAGDLLRHRAGDYGRASVDLQAELDAREFDRMKSATEDPAVQQALAKAEQKLAKSQPEPAPAANPLEELRRLAGTAANQAAAANILASIERQSAAPNFAAIVTKAIDTLQRMQ